MGAFSLTVTILKKHWRQICIGLSFLFFIQLIAILAPFAEKEYTQEVPSSSGIGGKATVSDNVRRYEPIVKDMAAKYRIEGNTEILLAYMHQESDGIGGKAVVSDNVRRYEPIVKEMAAKYGLEDYTEILLAYMQQESGGNGGDVMQSSESLGMPPNTITNPVVSIEEGVKYFSGLIKEAHGDIKTALQAYNFGAGFIDYALSHGGYSKKVVAAFSAEMATKMGWNSYGDINYADHVLRYFQGSSQDSPQSQEVNAIGWIKPPAGEISSPFGVTIDPFTGIPAFHKGAEIACDGKPIPVYGSQGRKSQ